MPTCKQHFGVSILHCILHVNTPLVFIKVCDHLCNFTLYCFIFKSCFE